MNTAKFLQSKGLVAQDHSDMMISGDFGSVSVGSLLTEFRNASLSPGVLEIDNERFRQISEKGWTAEHDDHHINGELANAAATYAMTEEQRDYMNDNWGNDMYLTMWPFDLSWLKFTPENRIKQLTKAGALIAAEIERLQREEACR